MLLQTYMDFTDFIFSWLSNSPVCVCVCVHVHRVQRVTRIGSKESDMTEVT